MFSIQACISVTTYNYYTDEEYSDRDMFLYIKYLPIYYVTLKMIIII